MPEKNAGRGLTSAPASFWPQTKDGGRQMTEAQAKKHLRSMLRSFTAGTVLHLLSELFGELAEEARRSGDEKAYQQRKEVEATLFVVGLGVDGACPREQQGCTR